MIIPSKVLSFIQFYSLIDPISVLEIGSKSIWTAPLVSYLKNGTLPNSKKVTTKLKVQAAQFILIKDIFYKKGFSRPFLRCLSPEEADYVMRGSMKGFVGTTQVVVISA